MINIEVFQLVVVSSVFGISLLGANLLFMRDRNHQVNLPLAWFFAAQALSVLPLIMVVLGASAGRDQITVLLELLTIPITMAQPILFWLYVRGLTSEKALEKIPHKILHLMPIAVVLLAVCLFATIPSDVIVQLDQGFVPTGLALRFKVGFLVATGFLFYFQVAFYLVKTVQLLTTYNSRLKDLFSSTKEHELAWIWWISMAAAIYLIIGSVGLLASVLEISLFPTHLSGFIVIEIIAELPIIWTIALWGLRQRPGSLHNIDTSKDAPLNTEVIKYGRSALTDERSARLAKKITHAMKEEHLYRDPNLSLWDLANHIGSTTSYISQTLNSTLGNSFFDYVNHWRIKDAVDQMKSTNKTVLEITYDVGFNSRSSFYKSFKREMGITPSALKQTKTLD